jgi:PAS domain S-box-containing protein
MKTSQWLEFRHPNVMDYLLEGCQIIGHDWRYLYLNDAAAVHGRKAKEELLGKTMMEMYPGIEHTEMFALLRDCMQNRTSHQIENEFTYPDGKKGWFDLRIEPVTDGIFIISIDITGRKEAENELIKSRNFLDRMIEQSSYAMWISDEKGTLIRINKACLDLFNLKEEEVVGKYNVLKDNIVKEQGFLPLVKSVYKKGEAVNFEIVYNTSQLNGLQFEKEAFAILDVTIFPIMDAGGKVTNAVIQHIDVTKRRKAEQALQESLQNMQLVVKAANVGLFDWDLVTDKVSFSPEWKRQIGYEEYEISDDNMEWQSRVHPDDIDRTLDTIHSYIREPWPDFRIEYRFRHKDGSYLWILSQASLVYDDMGMPARMLGSHVDITERKRIEETIKNERDLARQYLDIAGVMFLVLGADGTVLIVNKKACEGLERKEQDIVGKDWFNEFLPSRFRREAKTIHKKAMAGKEPFEDVHENIIVTAHGEERTIAWHTTLIKGERDEAIGVIGFGEDVTEQRQVEEERRKAEERYRRIFDNTAVALWEMDFSSVRDYIEELKKQGIKDIHDYIDSNPEKIHDLISRIALIDINEKTLSIFKANTKEELYNSFGKILTDSSVRSFLKCMSDFDAGKHTYRSEQYQKSVDGKDIVVDLTATIYPGSEETWDRVLITISDITARKQAEQALRDSEEKFYTAFHTSPDLITITSVADGKIVEVNKACTRITGYTRKEMIGHTALELDLPADKETRKRYMSIIEKKGHVVDMENGLRRKDGEVRQVLMSGEFIELSGEPYILTIIKDITARKQAEQALLESEERFNKAFHTSPDFIIITSVADDKIVEVNRACTGVSGYTRKELLGRSIQEFGLPAFPEDRERYASVMKKKGRVVDMETGILRKDGEIREVLMSGSLIELSGKRHVLTIVKDITERKQAEQALLESEDKFNKAFHASPDCMALLSLADGRITEANEACSRLTGYTREELIMHSVLELGIFKDPEAWQRYVVILQDDCRMVDMEAEVCRKDGEIRQVILSMDQIVLFGERYILLVSKDITERKKTEDKLQTSEFRFREMFENISSGVAVYTAIDNGEDFIIRDFNSAAERIDNKARKEVIGKSVQEVFPGVKEFGLFEVFQRVWRTGKAERFPVTFYSDNRISGWRENYVYKLPSGEIVAVYDDITDRKRAQLAVEESAEKLKQMFESVNDGIVVVDLNGVILEANEKAAKNYGISSKDELLGHNAFEFIAESDREKAGVDFRKTLKRGFSNVVEYNILKVDGSTFAGEVNAGVLRDTTGSSVSMIIVIRDVTERKQAEKKEMELEALKELDTVRSQLLANVSHELRTPLTSIKGFTSTLLRPDVSWSEEEKLEFLNTIDQESDRLIDLITDLLDMSRIESGRLILKRDYYDVVEIFNSVRGNMNKLAEQHKLILNMPDGLFPVFVDLTCIGQVITNLVENAVKYSPDGSEIIVEVSPADDFIIVSVTDQGEGIPPGDEEKVFDRFYQAESIVTGKKKGTGLGLSICRGIIEAHDGKIWVENVPGKGARFSFHVPYTEGSEDNVDDTGN